MPRKTDFDEHGRRIKVHTLRYADGTYGPRRRSKGPHGLLFDEAQATILARRRNATVVTGTVTWEDNDD